MIKVLEINSVPYGSTFQIANGIAKCGEKYEINIQTASGFSTHPIKALPNNHINIGGIISKAVHIALSKITGYHGFYSSMATKKLIKLMEEEKYDIVHFHNLHGWYVNLPMLFTYVKEKNIPSVWTLHDCWAFTGQCPHFTMIKCEKWKSECLDCPQYRKYPGTFIDKSREMWRIKKQWFSNISDMTIVTPSIWLSTLVKQSFLNDYTIKVINNGIDLSVFNPKENSFREKYNLTNKYIVLGVSFGWNNAKGLDVFIDLSKRLEKKYQIILVGTDEQTDKKLPQNIISIHRTQNQQELAEIYSAADVFVNPTREDNYPTVNMESIACGTPVITFRTGGSPEILDNTCGSVVDVDDIDAMEVEIKRICETTPYSMEACVAKAKSFDMNDRFLEYIELYKEIYDRPAK